MKVHIDFEACSALDLKKVGAWRWTKDTSTQPICYAFAVDAGPVISVTGSLYHAALEAAVDVGAEIHAWNAPFEYAFWNNVMAEYGWPELPIERFHCSMATAANYGLPMSLDQAAPACGAPFVKDKNGSLLMKRMARPRNVSPLTWWHDTDAGKLATLVDYNKADVEAERAVSARIPRMTDEEREIWLCDQRMNLRGFACDIALIDRLQKITDDEMARLSKDIEAITSGQVSNVTQVSKLVAWLKAGGVNVDSVAKDQLAELLSQSALPPAAKRALEIRSEAAKASTAKLTSMRQWTQDGRIRNMVQYYGALRTGRWAGRGPQVQNFPRGNVKHVELAIDEITLGAGVETLSLFFGRPLDVVSSSLRGCLIAEAGHELAVCDFSQIEARVVAWLGGQQDILDVFASGEDVYVYTAAKIGSGDRQLGKVAVLGLGFGMGAAKFVDAAAVYGIKLTEDRAQEVVSQWREANDRIAKLWWDCDRAARDVVDGKKATVRVGKLTFSMGTGLLDGCMLLTLPSGRPLVYRNARIEAKDGKLSITYDGVDQYTRKWTAIRTYGGKLVENATQAVARDLMALAMVRMEREGISLIATIHDEVIAEAPAGSGARVYNHMKQIMSEPPAWASGLPLGGAGFVGARYKKG